MAVFISICIPAYKRVEFLERLLDSIAIQSYKDFEVIVSDDSPTNDVSDLCEKYKGYFQLNYHKNVSALGTPENWNEAIRRANGKWIKLMHDDDWFSTSESLNKFAAAAMQNKANFIFSGYTNVELNSNKQNAYLMGWFERYLFKKSPVNLLKKNFIGHPSTTLIENNLENWYDSELKWVVDIEFYIRVLENKSSYHYIPETLANLGIGSEQVTATAFRNPNVEIPENIELLKKIKPAALKKIFAYDYYWRFIRNLSIRDISIVRKYYNDLEVPVLLQKMIKQQSCIPVKIIKIGFFSKITMLATYSWNYICLRMK